MAKRIVVIGAGASGMACAEALSAHPNKFQVTIIERAEVCGGVATSYSIDEKKFGATYINDGVQVSRSFLYSNPTNLHRAAHQNFTMPLQSFQIS